uniref:Uncharacterized protein n=1 Tax=Anguilla anguilla TaxID=7936 RepID=A0A0E9PJW3_ANGAN
MHFTQVISSQVNKNKTTVNVKIRRRLLLLLYPSY